ncbi:MAG TPA: nickel pincer cofactor biosynthesis protein LarB [Terriglobia bacterium]|nr:nickel pincer cofactor biosynthesis protein LarB [Terriglobia bacterium]
MSPEEITAMLEQVRSGKLGVEAAVDRLRNLPFEDIGYARIDHHRSLRQGFPEVIFARGKSPDHVVGIVQGMLRNRHNILITRGDGELYELIKPLDKRTQFHALSGAISIQRDRKIRGRGKILVVSAGTSDIPVAEEAQVTAEVMGNRVEVIYDVGVANIHRILSESKQLRSARIIIVVAGMVSVPVIAVPTSIGYGASFRGLAALLGMLNSCASNIATVNIDNGFGAGYLASVINRL